MSLAAAGPTAETITDSGLRAVGVGKSERLRNVHLTLSPGKLTGIVGPNGAGKSTLLSILSDICKPDAGEVLLNTNALSQWQPRQRAQQLALLPQHSVLTFPFRAFDVAMMGRYPHNTAHLHNIHIVEQVLRLLDCEDIAQKLYPKLSIGEKQRIQLARVLCQIWESTPFSSRYLLLDEPTASLDLAHQHLLFECLQQLKTTGVGIGVVLHDLNLALQYADDVALLHCGELAAYGPAPEVLNPTTIEQYFLVGAQTVKDPNSGVTTLITRAKRVRD